MLKLILCDDDQFTLTMLSTLINKAIPIARLEARLTCQASSGRELVQYLAQGNRGDLYFLDIDLGRDQLNGIDLVKQIYQYDREAKIVFVTSHSDKGMEVLRSGVRPFGFIEKSMDQGKMIGEYVRYLQMAAPETAGTELIRTIEIPVDLYETVTLGLDDILYVDSVKSIAHSICYHTFDGSQITVRDTLDHAQDVLGEDFLRTHRSVLVNRKGIIGFQDGQIKLANGEMAACALGKRKQIQAICAGQENGT